MEHRCIATDVMADVDGRRVGVIQNRRHALGAGARLAGFEPVASVSVTAAGPVRDRDMLDLPGRGVAGVGSARVSVVQRLARQRCTCRHTGARVVAAVATVNAVAGVAIGEVPNGSAVLVTVPS